MQRAENRNYWNNQIGYMNDVIMIHKRIEFYIKKTFFMLFNLKTNHSSFAIHHTSSI